MAAEHHQGASPQKRRKPARQYPWPPAKGLADIRAVSEVTALGVSTIWRLAAQDDTFPKPIKVGRNTTRFSWAEVHAWIDAKAAGTGPKKVKQ